MNNMKNLLVSSWLVSLFLILPHLTKAEDDSSALLLTECPTNATLSGYVTIDAFLQDYENNRTNTFTLCPEVIYEEPLVINASLAGVTLIDIRCPLETEEDVCQWRLKDGGSHIQVEAGSNGIIMTVEGIIFTQATETSILVHADGVNIFDFKDCAWTDNEGHAVVEFLNATATSNSADDSSTTTENRRLEEADSSDEINSYANFTDCIFQENTVETSVMYTETTNLQLDGCTFDKNIVIDSVIRLEKGHHHGIHATQITNHEFLRGAVYVAGGARLEEDDHDICGDFNVALEVCNATFYEIIDPDSCLGQPDFSECNPACLQYDACEDCHSSLDDFIAALPMGGEIRLCSDTIYELDDLVEPIEIGDVGPVTISCHSCTMRGSREQIRIVNGATDVTLDGILFTESTVASIVVQVDPTEPATLKINNCEFVKHSGDYIIMALNDEGDDAEEAASRRLEDAPIEAELQISDTLFYDNSNGKYAIENNAIRLIIEDCSFQGNIHSSAVGALGGDTILRSIQLGENEVDQGALYVGLQSHSFEVDNVCVRENFGDSCHNGTFYEARDPSACRDDTENLDACEEVCVEAEECELECVSTLDEMVVSIDAGGLTTICEGTTFDFDDSSTGFVDRVLAVTEGGTTIQCGEDGSIESSCVFLGGGSHIHVNTTMASFVGLTFRKAGDVSTVVVLDSHHNSHITFEDCLWEENAGASSLLIAGGNESSAGLTPRFLEDTAQMVPVNVTIFNSRFHLNTAQRSTIDVESGEVLLTDIEFSDNNVNLGLVYVGYNATVDQVGVCETSTTTGNVPCAGIFLQTTDFEDCVGGNIDACKAGCVSLDDCDGEQSCYDNWNNLTDAALNAEEGDVIVVCPDIELSVSQDEFPIAISQRNTTLKCGSDGRRDNNCIVNGGEVQVHINASDVVVEGMTFRDSSNFSVTAVSLEDGRVTLSDCEFSGHSGTAAVAVLNEELLDEQDSERGELVVESCDFHDNDVGAAALAGLGGDLTVKLSSFSENRGQAGAITMLSNATLSVMDSCFIGNSGNISGSILTVTSLANVDQENNFGDENEAVTGDCTGILSIASSFECTSFVAESCALDSSPEPSSAPSMENPTEETPVPTMAGGDDDDDETTSFPTASPTEGGPCFDQAGWEDLYEAVENSNGNERFVICEGTNIDMEIMEAIGFAPLPISASGITIRCASLRDGACLLAGGSTHIIVDGSVENLLLKGLTFEYASSASIVGNVLMPFSVEFDTCVWRENSANSTIYFTNGSLGSDDDGVFADDDIILGGGDDNATTSDDDDLVAGDDDLITTNDDDLITTNDDDLVGRRELQGNGDNYFVCTGCIFESNQATDGLIVGDGLTLVLEGVSFRDNEVESAIIAVDDSNTILRESCIEGSSSSGGSLITGSGSEVSAVGVFLDGNSGSSCNGYIDENGDCVEADSSAECIADQKRCFVNWEDLAGALGQLTEVDEGNIFTICPGTVFDLSNSDPIEIFTSRTTIRCDVNGARTGNCLVSGGSSQFRISGSPTNVLFSGITFEGASLTAIDAAGERNARASIVDCEFRGMQSGHAVVLIYHGDVPPLARRRRLAITDFTEPDERSMTVEVTYSSFISNIVELAPIANLKGTAIISSCEFSQNAGAAGAIGEWFSGSMSLSESCFTDNEGDLSGAVYVDGDTIDTDLNFGEGNEATGGSDCSAIYLATARASDSDPEGLCVDFTESSCAIQETPTVSPTAIPTLPPVPTSEAVTGSPTTTPAPSSIIECMDDWEELVLFVQNNLTMGIENILTLCPEKVIDAGDDPILLNTDDIDIVVECGLDGRMRDNCTISGGRIHFRIAGENIDVTFRGVQFQGSSEASIIAAADRESTVRFDECEWHSNEGQVVVLIYNEAEEGVEYDPAVSVIDLPITTAFAMSASFEDCVFIENPVLDAVVANLAGKAAFSFTAFVNNFNATVGSIVCRDDDCALSVTNCCFIQNDSVLAGTIFISESGVLEDNESNYGFDNRVGTTSCTDIFTLAVDENCIPSTCSGTCNLFEETECTIPGFEYDVPSTQPSVAPVVADDDTVLPPSPEGAGITLQATSLFDSGYFTRNILVAMIVAVLGFASFFYCKSQQGKAPKDKSNPEGTIGETAPEDEPLHNRNGRDTFNDEPPRPAPPINIDMVHNNVILDPDEINKKKQKKNPTSKLASIFGSDKKKQEPQQQTFMSAPSRMAPVSAAPPQMHFEDDDDMIMPLS